MNREKVIKGLECCTKGNVCFSDCPYFKEVPMTDGKCILILQADALALLKEQEAVKPEHHFARHSTKPYGMEFWYTCGSCVTEIRGSDKFCHECGQAVKWE